MVSYKNHSAASRRRRRRWNPTCKRQSIAIMRGAPPLVLFTTMARDRRLFFKFFNSGLLDRGNLTIRQREIVIDRVTATAAPNTNGVCTSPSTRPRLGLTGDPDRLVWSSGGPDDDCWADEDRVLIRLCDGLQQSSTVDDDVWADLTVHHSDEAILELLMLAGTYRTVSYLVNGLRLPLEPGAGRFPA